MKNVTSILTNATLILFVGSTTMFAQSVDRIIRQERARQARTVASGKVYTNLDLEQFKAPVTSQATDADTPDASDPSAKSKESGKTTTEPKAATEPSAENPKADSAKKSSEAAAPVRDMKYWRQQASDARTKIQSLENKSDVLQLRLNDLNNKFQREQDVPQREAYQTDIQKTLLEVDETKSQLEAARRDLEDVERQARRENVPPGWIR